MHFLKEDDDVILYFPEYLHKYTNNTDEYLTFKKKDIYRQIIK